MVEELEDVLVYYWVIVIGGIEEVGVEEFVGQQYGYCIGQYWYYCDQQEGGDQLGLVEDWYFQQVDVWCVYVEYGGDDVDCIYD